VYRIYKDDTMVFKIFHNGNYGFSIGYHDGVKDVELSTPIPNAPIALTTNKKYNLVVYFDFSDVNNATVKVYLDNQLAAQWEGDASVFTSDGNINRIRMYRFSGGYTYWSEFIVADKDTNLLNHGVASFIPYADGTDTEFTGTYANIDEVAMNDDDYIFSDTPGQKQSFNFKTLLDVDDETIEKLALSARVKMVEGSGITKFRFYFVLDGTKYYSDYYSVQTYWDTYRFEQDVRPDNGLKWTRDDLLSIEVGVESAE